jgi:hypothetical protein
MVQNFRRKSKKIVAQTSGFFGVFLEEDSTSSEQSRTIQDGTACV